MFPSHSPILPPPLRRVMMVRRKINGANVVLIYLKYAYYAWLNLICLEKLKLSYHIPSSIKNSYIVYMSQKIQTLPKIG